MKRTFLKFLPIAAAVLLATSCSKDNDGDNSVASAPTVETQHFASPIESKSVTFSIKVTGGGSLSKVTYKDNGSIVTVKFDASDKGKKMLRISDGNVMTELPLKEVDANGVATFEGDWGEVTEPSVGAEMTAVLLDVDASPIQDHSDFSTVSIEALMESCDHTYTGTFQYKTDNIVSLKDDKAYIEIIMSPLQKDIDLKFNSDDTPTNYAMNGGKVWIAVADGTTFTTNFTDSKTCQAGQIKTIKREGFVDLGINKYGNFTGILWADHNLGGTNPEDYGNYYAWGETATKETYNWITYMYANGDYNKLTKYCNNTSYGNDGFTDSYTVLGRYEIEGQETVDDDIAHVTNAKWSMPTTSEFAALKSSCYWEWTDKYDGKTFNSADAAGIIVYKVKSSGDAGVWVTKNGTKKEGYSLSDTHIFLPAAGYRYLSKLNEAGTIGRYWSSSLYTDKPTGAFDLYFHSGDVSAPYHDLRTMGQSVRAVRRK